MDNTQPQTEQPAQNNLQAGHVLIQAVVHVTRAATGKVETYNVTGTAPAEAVKEA